MLNSLYFMGVEIQTNLPKEVMNTMLKAVWSDPDFVSWWEKEFNKPKTNAKAVNLNS